MPPSMNGSVRIRGSVCASCRLALATVICAKVLQLAPGLMCESFNVSDQMRPAFSRIAADVERSQAERTIRCAQCYHGRIKSVCYLGVLFIAHKFFE